MSKTLAIKLYSNNRVSKIYTVYINNFIRKIITEILPKFLINEMINFFKKKRVRKDCKYGITNYTRLSNKFQTNLETFRNSKTNPKISDFILNLQNKSN